MCATRCSALQLLLLVASALLVSCAEGSRKSAADARQPPADVGAQLAEGESSIASPREPCVIAAVSDGDSLRCSDQRRVRLLLLDAPEMSQAPFGARSRDALRALLRRGDTLWLEYDVQRTDQYGRTLAHGWTADRGGVHVNLRQATAGWALAVVFPPNVRYVETIREAVAEARRERRGLWSDGRFTCTPTDHKRNRC